MTQIEIDNMKEKFASLSTTKDQIIQFDNVIVHISSVTLLAIVLVPSPIVRYVVKVGNDRELSKTSFVDFDLAYDFFFRKVESELKRKEVERNGR